jgi:ABC-type uncharacterized transport system substrate-binding protein
MRKFCQNLDEGDGMKRYIFIVLVLLSISTYGFPQSFEDFQKYSFPNNGKENILILVSDEIPSFNDVKNEFINSVQGDYNYFVVNFKGDRKYLGEVASAVLSKKVDLVVTIGSMALEAVVGKVNAPIVFSMVIDYKKFGIDKYKNVAGVSVVLPSESVFYNLKALIPNVSKVGVICSEKYYKEFLEGDVATLRAIGIELKQYMVSSPSEFKKAFYSASKETDILWMVPDTMVLDKENISFFLQESLKSYIPNVVFSENFVIAGGFFSVSLSYPSIGSQLGIIVRKILEDKEMPSNVGIVPPVGTYTAINKKYLGKMKFSINEFMLGSIDKVIE